jgi:tetratricopeptide (TPR) repeat protein
VEASILLGRVRAPGSRLIGAVFLVALVIRFLYLLGIRHSPLTDVLLIDSETYDRLARMILGGTFRGEEVYAMNPLYPYFLAGVYALGEGSKLLAFGVQAGLDAASCAMIAWIGIRLFGAWTGGLAGLGAAVYGPLVFYTGTLLTPTIIVFLMLVTTVLLVRYQMRPGWRWALSAGIVLGLASLGRGNNFLLVPLAALFFRIHGGGWKPALRHGLLFAAGALFVVGGMTARNYLVEGKLVPISANFAAFYVGHNPGATGIYQMPDFTSGAGFQDEVWGTREAISAKVGRPLTLAEASTELFREGLAFAKEHPGAEARLALTKFYYFWNRTESPTNLSYSFARDFSGVLRALPLGFGVVAPLGLLGLGLAGRRRREHLVLHLVLAVTVLTGLFFFVSAEYRMPAVPVLLLFAAHAVEVGVRRLPFGSRNPVSMDSLRPWALALPALILLFVFTHVRDERLRFQSLKRVDYLNFGTLYKDRGDYEKARGMLRRSLAIDPRYAPAYQALADVERRAGNEIEAARWAAEGRRWRPEAVGTAGTRDVTGTPVAAGRETADLLLQAGELYKAKRYPEALLQFEALRGRAEASGDADLRRSTLNNIGLCRFQQGDLARADSIFTGLIALDSTYVKAYNNLGKVRAAQGRTGEAESLFRKALALDPGNRIARGELERLVPGR